MFKPVNRYVLVEGTKTEENQTDTGIILPDSFKPTQERHATVAALDWAEDVRFKDALSAAAKVGKTPTLVVDKSMLEEICVDGVLYNVILDNYIIGIF